MSTNERLKLKRVVPLLQVGSMSETLVYYLQVLGFSLDLVWPSESAIVQGEIPETGVQWAGAKWAQVSRDNVRFSFSMDLGTSSSRFIAEKGNGVVFYILVDEIERIYNELAGRGAVVVQELHDFGGRRQFSIADPNGYVLAFSEDL